MGFGSKLKKAFSSAVSTVGSETERASQGLHREYKRWGRDALKSYGYGALEQVRLGVKYGAKAGGYSDKESESLGDGLGANYQQVQARKVEREIGEDEAERGMQMAERERAEATRARLATQVRVRRSGRGNRPTTHGGTLVTGALGLPGTATPDRATKLGL